MKTRMYERRNSKKIVKRKTFLMYFSKPGMLNLYAKVMLFHKVAVLNETHTFNNSFAKFCTISLTTTLFKSCIVSPTTIIFKKYTVSHSTTLHKILAIF